MVMRSVRIFGRVGAVALLGVTLCLDFARAETPVAAAQAAPQSGVVPASTAAGAPAQINSGLLSKFVMSYWGNFAGPSIGTPGAFSPNTDGTPGDPVKLNSHLTLGYKPSNWLVGAVIETNYRPVLGQSLQLKDPYLKVGNTKLIENGALKLGSDFRVYMPLTETSRTANKAFAVRWNQNFTYEIPGTRWTIASYSFIKNTFYSQSGGGTDLELYMAPYANYQWTKKVAVTFWVDLVQLSHKRGTSLAQMKNADWDFEPGINWDISERFSINPYLNFYPGNLSWESSSFGMIITGKLI